MGLHTGDINSEVSRHSTRPSMSLDFKNGKSKPYYVDYTRSSQATYWDKDGNMKVAAVNEVPFDHNPATGESLGVPFELPRTNLFGGVILGYGNAPASASNTEGLLGAIDASIPVPDATADRYQWTSGSYSAGQRLTLSWFEKPLDKAYGVDLGNSQSTGIAVNGELNMIRVGILIEEDCGNGWYRYAQVFEVNTTASITIRAYFGAQIGIANTNQVAFWGFQIEAGDFHTSYILPGTTRARGVMNLNSNYPISTKSFGENGLSIYIEGKSGNQHAKQAITNYQLVVMQFTSSILLIRLGNPSSVGATGNAVAQHYISGVAQVAMSTNYTIGLRQQFKIAARFKNSGSVISLNGGTLGSDSSANMDVSDVTGVGIGGGSQPFSSGWIGKIAFYTRGLTNSQIIEITEV